LEGAVAEDFAGEVARLASKAHLAEVIKQSLNELLGEPAASAVVYHLGGYEALQNPEVFEGKLRDLFGTGANLILRYILRKMETSLETSSSSETSEKSRCSQHTGSNSKNPFAKNSQNPFPGE